MMKSMKTLAVGGALLAALALAPGFASAATFDSGLTIPDADPALAYIAPTPDQPNYDARLQAFLEATVPDTWNGQPVDFLQTVQSVNTTGVDVTGLPTSAPKADPNNPNFVYQRFQNDVLFYNASEGSTTVLPLS